MSTLIIDVNGIKRWYNQNGQLHRLNGPAVEYTDGSKEFYQNDQRHRQDGPAFEDIYGFKIWYQNDRYHRPDGPAIKYSNGDKSWYLNGLRHRLYGPAIDYRGTKAWYKNGVKWPQGEAIYTTTEITLCLLPLQLPAYVVQWILEWVCPEVTRLNQVKLINLIQGIKNSHKLIYAKGGETF
jgi:hypothetical protein